MPKQQMKIWGLTLLLAGLALCGCSLWLLLSPPQYQATAKIRVMDDDFSNPLNRPGKANDDGGFDPFFTVDAAKEIQLALQTHASEILNLNKAWAEKDGLGTGYELPQSAGQMLRNTRVVPDKSESWQRLWFIRVQNKNSAAAAFQANAIANAYVHYADLLTRERFSKGFESFEKFYQDQGKQIQTMQADVNELETQLKAQTDVSTNQLTEQKYYQDKKLQLEQLIQQHQLDGSKIEAVRNDRAIPKYTTVQIVEQAVPSEFPVGPNHVTDINLLGIGLISTLSGWLLLKSARRP